MFILYYSIVIEYHVIPAFIFRLLQHSQAVVSVHGPLSALMAAHAVEAVTAAGLSYTDPSHRSS